MRLTGTAKLTLRELNKSASKNLTSTLTFYAQMTDQDTPYAQEIILLHDFYSDLLALVQHYQARLDNLEKMEPN